MEYDALVLALGEKPLWRAFRERRSLLFPFAPWQMLSGCAPT